MFWHDVVTTPTSVSSMPQQTVPAGQSHADKQCPVASFEAHWAFAPGMQRVWKLRLTQHVFDRRSQGTEPHVCVVLLAHELVVPPSEVVPDEDPLPDDDPLPDEEPPSDAVIMPDDDPLPDEEALPDDDPLLEEPPEPLPEDPPLDDPLSFEASGSVSLPNGLAGRPDEDEDDAEVVEAGLGAPPPCVTTVIRLMLPSSEVVAGGEL